MVQVLVMSQVEMTMEEALAVLAEKLPDMSQEEFLAECEKFQNGQQVYLTKNELGNTTMQILKGLQ